MPYIDLRHYAVTGETALKIRKLGEQNEKAIQACREWCKREGGEFMLYKGYYVEGSIRLEHGPPDKDKKEWRRMGDQRSKDYFPKKGTPKFKEFSDLIKQIQPQDEIKKILSISNDSGIPGTAILPQVIIVSLDLQYGEITNSDLTRVTDVFVEQEIEKANLEPKKNETTETVQS